MISKHISEFIVSLLSKHTYYLVFIQSLAKRIYTNTLTYSKANDCHERLRVIRSPETRAGRS